MEPPQRRPRVEKFVKGDIIVILFPFSDLSQAKKRPALVIQAFQGNDLLLCQITSQTQVDQNAIELNTKELTEGKLAETSFIRINKLFTADESLIHYRLGKIQTAKMNEIVEKLIELIKN